MLNCLSYTLASWSASQKTSDQNTLSMESASRAASNSTVKTTSQISVHGRSSWTHGLQGHSKISLQQPVLLASHQYKIFLSSGMRRKLWANTWACFTVTKANYNLKTTTSIILPPLQPCYFTNTAKSSELDRPPGSGISFSSGWLNRSCSIFSFSIYLFWC